uniref:Major facilitator superfamily (MFS) profile domain-containing protein n=1 Tax=Araucaria cunninghamii TaxID=56994 RepID=A0A0D6R4K2_ARACU
MESQTNNQPEKNRFSMLGWISRRKGEESSTESCDGEETRNHQPFVAGRELNESYAVSAVIFVFLFPALGGLLFGYDIGATSGADVSLESAERSGTDWYNMSSIENGLVVSGSLFGALIGSIISFKIADILGRRRVLFLAAMLYIIGALVSALAPDFIVLIIGRFIFGFGIGLAMHSAPLYIAETSPPQIRGRLISLKEFFIVIGMLLGYLVSSLAVDAVGGWRYMYGASIPLAIIMGLGMWWLPPSPRWILLCAIQGRGDMEELKIKATSILNRLRGQPVGNVASNELIEDYLRSLQDAYQDQEQKVSIWQVFQGTSLKALIIGGGLVFFQQITGQPSVLYYAAKILQSAGLSAASSATRVSVIIGFFKLLMTGTAVLIVDKVGRRPLLITGVTGMVVSLFLLAAYYKYLGSAPVLAVIALLLYVGSYQTSFGPIGWLMISEIFPLHTRGRGISIAVLINFATNALVTFSFSPLRELLGTAFLFLIFGGIGVLALCFIIFVVPETKGLTLEEIESKLLK